MTTSTKYTCDVLVVGAGGAGLTAAVSARSAGLDVLLVDKSNHVGGTTAISGGSLWVPGNPVAAREGIQDGSQAARAYLRAQMGERFNASLVDAYLEQASELIGFLEQHSAVRFYCQDDFPDFLPNLEGGMKDGGRTICAEPFYGAVLGEHAAKLPLPLYTQTALGMMTTPRDLTHFQNWVRSPRSFLYVARRLWQHKRDMARYGRTMWLTNGNALVARLLRTALNLDIPIRLSSAVTALACNDAGAICGATLRTPEGSVQVAARRGVVLACGGLGHGERATRFLPRPSLNGEDWSLSAQENTGDAIALAESHGARVAADTANVAMWAPVSRVPTLNGMLHGHYCDRHKPGFIAVTPDGRRFVNESESYHHFCEGLIRATPPGKEAVAYLVTDQAGIKRYGIGAVLASPFPLEPHLRSGYLLCGDTVEALADAACIDATTLARTIAEYNRHAGAGSDPEFGRGSSSFNLHFGNSKHKPNGCIGPLAKAPYYAVRMTAGQMASLVGLETDAKARVMSRGGAPIPGLYAVGEAAGHIFAGACPGAGMMLGAGMTFGYIAGRHLAEQGVREDGRVAESRAA